MHTFYGLTEPPFALTPDPKFLYWSPTHRQVLQLFVRSRQHPHGILVVTGARGTGKTTLLQAFATISEPRTHIVSLPHAPSSVDNLYILLAQQMGLDSATPPPSTQRSQLHTWLVNRVQYRERMIVLLDNAHEWSESLLAELAVFAGLGISSYKFFHLMLAGPLSLPDSLRAPRLASLRAHITGMGELLPLTLRDTQAYIQQCLTIAGGPKESLFAPAAVDVIYRYTQGIPRAINQLCSQVLLAGCAAHVPRLEAALVQHVATRMGLPAPASPPLATCTPRGTAPATPQPTAPRTRWSSTARQHRGRTARLTGVLLPLGVLLLMAAGSVLRPGGGLQERGAPMLAAPRAVGHKLPATADPLLPSDRALAAKADTVAGAGHPHPPAPGAGETKERQAPLASESAQEAEPSPPASPLATARTTRLRTSDALPTLRAHGAASATSRTTPQRPPQALDTTHREKPPRVQRHEPVPPLAPRGFAAAPIMPTRADSVTHDTSAALEHAIPTRQAQVVQDDLPLGAAPSPHGATETRFSGHASDAPESTQPRLPLSPPTEVAERPAALPRSPEPPSREAAPPAPRTPTIAEVMTRPVPTPAFQGRTVEIHTGLAQTSVLINGAYIGPSPVVIHLPLGVYTMAIDRPGYPQMTWKMHVDPNGVALHMTKSGGWAWPPSYTPRVVAH